MKKIFVPISLICLMLLVIGQAPYIAPDDQKIASSRYFYPLDKTVLDQSYYFNQKDPNLLNQLFIKSILGVFPNKFLDINFFSSNSQLIITPQKNNNSILFDVNLLATDINGAPSNASYLVLGLNSGLTSERVLTAGTNISFSDSGANGTLTINATTSSGGVTRAIGGFGVDVNSPIGDINFSIDQADFNSLGDFRYLKIVDINNFASINYRAIADLNKAFYSQTDANNVFIKITDSNNIARLDQKVIRDLNLAFYAQKDANNVFVKKTDSNAAGSNTEVQFNNNGALGADANFTYNSATDFLNTHDINVFGNSRIFFRDQNQFIYSALVGGFLDFGALTNLVFDINNQTRFQVDSIGMTVSGTQLQLATTNSFLVDFSGDVGEAQLLYTDNPTKLSLDVPFTTTADINSGGNLRADGNFLCDGTPKCYRISDLNLSTSGGVTSILAGSNINVNANTGSVLVSVNDTNLALSFYTQTDANTIFIKIADSNNLSRLDFKVIRDINRNFYGQTDANNVFYKKTDANTIFLKVDGTNNPIADINFNSFLINTIGSPNTRFKSGGGLDLAGRLDSNGGIRIPSNFDLNFGSSNQVNFRLDTSLDRMLLASSSIFIMNNTLDMNQNRFTNIGTGLSFFSVTGGLSMGDTINMSNNLISNIGSAQTDFTSTGGLNLGGDNLNMGNQNLILNVGNVSTDFTSGGGLALAGDFNVTLDGNFKKNLFADQNLTVSNKLKIKEGTNRCMGASTLVGGSVRVTTNCSSTNSRIFLTGQNISGTVGDLSTGGIRAGSFDINSSSILDTRLVAWFIVEIG